jgi:hypothetical protein
MHYRLMDPQPPEGWMPGPKVTGTDWLLDGGGRVYIPRMGSANHVAAVPRDMSAATPWHDREGLWYWRIWPQSS